MKDFVKDTKNGQRSKNSKSAFGQQATGFAFAKQPAHRAYPAFAIPNPEGFQSARRIPK